MIWWNLNANQIIDYDVEKYQTNRNTQKSLPKKHSRSSTWKIPISSKERKFVGFNVKGFYPAARTLFLGITYSWNVFLLWTMPFWIRYESQVSESSTFKKMNNSPFFQLSEPWRRSSLSIWPYERRIQRISSSWYKNNVLGGNWMKLLYSIYTRITIWGTPNSRLAFDVRFVTVFS